MRTRGLLHTTAVLLIVGAALPTQPAEAARRRTRPPANVLAASVRVDVETGLLDPSGSWLLDVGGRSVLVRMALTSKGRLSGVAWYDGSEITVSGRTRRTRRSQTLSLSGVSYGNERPDARLTVRGTVDGDGEFTGFGRLTRRSGFRNKTGVSKRTVAASGTTPGAGSMATVRLHLDVEPKVGSAAGASLTGQALVRAASLDLLVFGAPLNVKGTARGTNGDDAVRLSARKRGARLTLTGEHDGTRFTGVLTGAVGMHVFRRAPLSFDTGNAPVDAGTALGSAAARVTVPLSGRLDGDLELNTTKGLTLRIPQGTKLITPTGQLLVGEVELRLRGSASFGGLAPAEGDPGASFDVFAFPVDEDGTAAIDAAADSTGGRGVPVLFVPTDPEPVEYARVYVDSSDERLRLTVNVGVRFEPEDVPSFGDPSQEITFGWGDKVAPRLGLAHDLGGNTLLSASYALYADNLLAIGDVSKPTFATEGTGSSGLGGYTYLVDFDPGLPAPELHEIGIPGDDAGEFPKVKSVSISSVGTGQVLATARAAGAGLGLGETMAARSLDGTASYEFEVVGAGGGRFVRLRTPFLNAFSIRVVYCNADGTLGVVSQEPPTNPGGEVVVAGPYDGRIDVEFRGQGGLDPAAEDVFDLSEAVGDDGVVVPRRFEPEAGGAYLATARVFGYTLAISTLADRLGAAFEADISGHRRITIQRVAVIGSVLAVCGLDDSTLNFLDALTLLVRARVKLPGRPGAVVLGPSGRRAYVTTPKRLICVDVEAARIVRSVRVRGLLPHVALDPTGRRIYVGNSRGEFLAYDARTLRKLWSVGGFGGESAGSISLAHGGRYAYFTQPTATPAQICGVDLLGAAHTVGSRKGFNWALPCVPYAGAQDYAVSHDGLRGVVSVPAFGEPNAGRLTILDTTTWAPIRTLPGLNGPIQVAWTEDDGLVVSPSFNDDTLVVMDPDSGAFTTVGGIDGANGLAVFRTADGMDLAYTGGFEDDTLHVRDIIKSGALAPRVGENVNESVQLDFQPGPMSAQRQFRFGARYSFKR